MSQETPDCEDAGVLSEGVANQVKRRPVVRRHGRRAPCDTRQEQEDLRSVLESSPKRHIKKNRELVIYRLGIIARKVRRNALKKSF